LGFNGANIHPNSKLALRKICHSAPFVTKATILFPGLIPEAARERARVCEAVASCENVQRRYCCFEGGEEDGVGGCDGEEVWEDRKVEGWCMQTSAVRFGYLRAGALRRS
jgi:hypothetical protein